MTMPKSITMTRDGGNFWRAMLFRHMFTSIIILPVVLVVMIGILNPLWFRDTMFRWIENSVNKISQWRNYRVYSIYLGTDPKMWHTLKDSV